MTILILLLTEMRLKYEAVWEKIVRSGSIFKFYIDKDFISNNNISKFEKKISIFLFELICFVLPLFYLIK